MYVALPVRRAFLLPWQGARDFAGSMADLGRNAMKRPEKEAVVAQLTEQFRNADAVYLTEYRGLTVPQVSELREKLGRDTSYTVAKNTLARIAAKEAGI